MPTKTPRGERTLQRLQQALTRLVHNRPQVVKKGRRVSIAAVAEEAGVSRATIHQHYPEIAEKIRAESGKSLRTQRRQNTALLKAERAKNKQLRQEIRQLTKKVRMLASNNATLMLENAQLKVIGDTDVPP